MAGPTIKRIITANSSDKLDNLSQEWLKKMSEKIEILEMENNGFKALPTLLKITYYHLDNRKVEFTLEELEYIAEHSAHHAELKGETPTVVVAPAAGDLGEIGRRQAPVPGQLVLARLGQPGGELRAGAGGLVLGGVRLDLDLSRTGDAAPLPDERPAAKEVGHGYQPIEPDLARRRVPLLKTQVHAGATHEAIEVLG